MARALEQARPGLLVEVLEIRTSGDEASTSAVRAARVDEGSRVSVPGDKSRFTKEIEDALLRGEIDLAVHSAKDVPTELPQGLEIVAVPERVDPRDAVCGAPTLAALAEGARVGTSSLRRRSQLLARRPDLRVLELRGNVDTRLRRLAEGTHDALVLAAAGLVRLGHEEGSPVPEQEMLPAAGQGCLALEARVGDHDAAALAALLHHAPSGVALRAERALVGALEASCHTPVGAHAREREGGLVLDAYVGLPDGSHWIRDAAERDPTEPEVLGAEVARRMLAAGARELLAEAERFGAPG